MGDKFITLQIPSDFFVKFTDKSACFKLWGRRPFNAPFSMMDGFGKTDDNTDLLELTTNEYGECYEFSLKEWLLDQDDNKRKLEKFFVEPPEPELPLFDMPKAISNPFLARQNVAQLNDSELDKTSALDRQEPFIADEDEDWKRLEAIGESLEENIFIETEYEQ